MADRLRSRLLAWYDQNKRDLPWRKTRDPYAVWVSETMLQQTTVGVVVPYYQRWMERFPTVQSLAASSENEVLSLWQGLGYYRRARNLRAAAGMVVKEGRFPVTIDGWLDLPGVGKYTAGAVCAIAFGQETPAADGNVQRVFSRLTGDGGADFRKNCDRWADRLVQGDRPGDLVQALMELGALVCLPKNPACPLCPLKALCKARKLGLQGSLPPKAVKPAVVQTEQSIVVPECHGYFGVRQIMTGNWWKGMFEFGGGTPGRNGVLLGSFSHTVTRHRIRVTVYLKSVQSRSAGLDWYKAIALEALPMPAHQRKAARMATKHAAQSGNNSRGRTTAPVASKK